MWPQQNSLRSGGWVPTEGGKLRGYFRLCEVQAAWGAGPWRGRGHGGLHVGPEASASVRTFTAQTWQPADWNWLLHIQSKSIKNELIWERGKHLKVKSHVDLGVHVRPADTGGPAEKPLQEQLEEGKPVLGSPLPQLSKHLVNNYRRVLTMESMFGWTNTSKPSKRLGFISDRREPQWFCRERPNWNLVFPVAM